LTHINLNGLDLSCVPKSHNDVVEIRLSTIPNAGNGLFAKCNLPMATLLGFYFGVPTMEDEFDQNKDKSIWKYGFPRRNQIICWTKWYIKKGKELFVYYSGEVNKEHWDQAEDISEPIVSASEEDEIVFSDDR
ncbi:58_t:CDS:2, partial [Gigaspora rosea]